MQSEAPRPCDCVKIRRACDEGLINGGLVWLRLLFSVVLINGVNLIQE